MSSEAWKAICYQHCIPAALIGRVTERHHVNGAWIEFLLSATRGISPGRLTAGTFSAPAILWTTRMTRVHAFSAAGRRS